MANIIIQKDGQTIAVNPRKLNFIANGNVIFDIVESPPKTAVIGITAAGSGAGIDLFILSPNGGEKYLYNPTFTSTLNIIAPATGSVVKQYHPITVVWSKTSLTFVDVAYSVDNGTNWVQVASSSIDIAATFNMPGIAVDTPMLITVKGNSINLNTTITDEFTSIVGTSPTGSSYVSGSVIPLGWTTTNLPTINIAYSFDNSNWVNILTNATGSSYNWAYPGGNIGHNTYIRYGESPIPYIFVTRSFLERANIHTIVLTSGTTWTVPADWNSDANTIEVIGGGGGGRYYDGGGGGGGAYSRVSNVVLTPGASIPISIGAGGAGGLGSGGTGGDTSFGAILLAKGGSGAFNRTGATGGQASVGTGTIKYSGGNGGNSTGSDNQGGGGGGAAYALGSGSNAANTSGTNTAGTAGGKGNNLTVAGGASLHQGGGGGGGSQLPGSADNVDGSGGAGGTYGGGGGGGNAAVAGGSGAGGAILITY